MTAGSHRETPPTRVYISSGAGRTREADLLRSSFAEVGASVVASPGEAGDLAEQIDPATLFVVVSAPGDENNKMLQYEIRIILQKCWAEPSVRVFVIADAVGAIPSSLRSKPFVYYLASSEIGLDRWRHPDDVSELTRQMIEMDGVGRTQAGLMSDAEVREWRNRVVHIGTRDLDDNPVERSRVLDQLERDLAATPDGLDGPDALEWILDRASLAAALKVPSLVRQYNEKLRQHGDRTREEEPQETADDAYRLGLVALDSGDLDRARQLFERAVAHYV